MPPPSRATGFDRLAPAQRAAVELVLRQARSYGELAALLGMPEETIRVRARGGLEGLAPDLPAPARAGEIADWLLGQQSESDAARTRELLLSDPAAQRWVATVAAPLRELAGGAGVPALPTGSEPPEARLNGQSARPRRAEARAPAAPPGGISAALPGGSSRLGGALLILAAVVVVGAVLAFAFLRSDGSSNQSADSAAAPAAAPATATASPAPSGNDIVLRGPAGSKAVGLMRLFEASDGTVRFALAAQGVAPNKAGETYSVWFRKRNGSARLLGDVKDPVTAKGELTSAGPGNDDVGDFPQWLVSYDSVLVTRDGAKAKQPGTVILSGDLPRAGSR